MTCPKCGMALPDDSAFCQYCGSRATVEGIVREEANPLKTSDGSGRSSPQSAGIVERTDESTTETLATSPTTENEYTPAQPTSSITRSNSQSTTRSEASPPQESNSRNSFLVEGAFYCKKCGQSLPGDSQFCQYCGSRKIFESKGNSQRATPMTCPKCGMALPDDSAFCQYCGSTVTVEGIVHEEANPLKTSDGSVESPFQSAIIVERTDESTTETLATSPTTENEHTPSQPTSPITMSNSQSTTRSETSQPQESNSPIIPLTGSVCYCKKCGQSLPADSKFCQYCGSRELLVSENGSRGETDEKRPCSAIKGTEIRTSSDDTIHTNSQADQHTQDVAGNNSTQQASTGNGIEDKKE